MIHIDYNSTKNLTFYLQPSLSVPIYLLSFVNYTTRERTNCIAPDVSTTSTMLQLTVQEVGTGAVNLLLGMVSLVPMGEYVLEVYEQTSTTNTDPTASGTTLLGNDIIIVHQEPTYDSPPVRNDIAVSTADFNTDFNSDFLV